jgi:hypothetical protein
MALVVEPEFGMVVATYRPPVVQAKLRDASVVDDALV